MGIFPGKTDNNALERHFKEKGHGNCNIDDPINKRA